LGGVAGVGACVGGDGFSGPGGPSVAGVGGAEGEVVGGAAGAGVSGADGTSVRGVGVSAVAGGSAGDVADSGFPGAGDAGCVGVGSGVPVRVVKLAVDTSRAAAGAAAVRTRDPATTRPPTANKVNRCTRASRRGLRPFDVRIMPLRTFRKRWV
jgi:hypothetical protein